MYRSNEITEIEHGKRENGFVNSTKYIAKEKYIKQQKLNGHKLISKLLYYLCCKQKPSTRYHSEHLVKMVGEWVKVNVKYVVLINAPF
ncbi:MAG: hypothetical protein O7C56_08990 [Rickettsia endosymbiont of Ixodes persulcatus]|nr:hypothetical protein [Rickettsia endosymbiont of Ixodes persulcatus]